jgi:hypothetical protein
MLTSFLSEVRGRPELQPEHHHHSAEEKRIHADALKTDEGEGCVRDFSMRFQGCIDECKDLSQYILRASHAIPRHSIFYRSSYQKSLGLPPTHALIKVPCMTSATHLRSEYPYRATRCLVLSVLSTEQTQLEDSGRQAVHAPAVHIPTALPR